jgi:hypothetical protein
MKVQLLLSFALLAAASFVKADDFDRSEWEEIPINMVDHGTVSARSMEEDVNTLEKRWMYNNKVVTWYNGGDLQNPACYPGKVPRIRDSMRIAAIKDKRKCFWCVKITVTRKHPKRSDLVLRSTRRHTKAKIIDFCPSCDTHGEKVNSSHIDLSLGAFKELGPRSAGELPITWKKVKCYRSKYWPRTPHKKY